MTRRQRRVALAEATLVGSVIGGGLMALVWITTGETPLSVAMAVPLAIVGYLAGGAIRRWLRRRRDRAAMGIFAWVAEVDMPDYAELELELGRALDLGSYGRDRHGERAAREGISRQEAKHRSHLEMYHLPRRGGNAR